MDNMKFYELGRSVPKEAQKQFSTGKFTGTDINPMWRIKKLTEIFGPCGVGWYYEVLSERCEEHDGQTMSIVDLNLFIKVDGEWSKPIYGTGGNMLVRKGKNGNSLSDEGYKMALTDALSIACKSLGIGADIWFANDVTKYTVNNEPKAETKELKTNDLLVCEECLQNVSDVATKDGGVMKASDVARLAYKETGRILCADCLKEARRQKKAAERYANREDGTE